MKKVVSICVALMLMLAITCPAFAAEDSFVPSISEKAAPRVVADEQGDIGAVVDENGTILDKVGQRCLIITSVAQVQNKTTALSESDTHLLEVYQKLLSGEMTIPVEKLGCNPETTVAVIRELVDMSWYCEEHPEMVAPEGVYFRITLDLRIAPEDTVHVMTYKNGEWNPIVEVVNNEDGTVTCTFENLCPVAFVMTQEQEPADPGASLQAKWLWWLLLLLLILICVAVYLWHRKTRKY